MSANVNALVRGNRGLRDPTPKVAILHSYKTRLQSALELVGKDRDEAGPSRTENDQAPKEKAALTGLV